MDDIAKAYKMKGYDLTDDPKDIWNHLINCGKDEPVLFNIRTNRLFWHAGAGIDDPNIPDTHKNYITYFGRQYDNEAKEIVKEAWKKCLR